MFKNLDLLNNLVVPLVSAQFYFVFLLYFAVAGKQLTRQYRFYILFLVGFSFFILARAAFYVVGGDLFWIVVYLRIPVLFSLAAPCLIIATAQHCRFRLNRKKRWLLVLLGVLFSLAHTVLNDLHRADASCLLRLGWVPPEWPDFPVIMNGLYQTLIQVGGGILLFVVPCAFLLVKEWYGERRTNPLAFISGVLLFGILFVIGTWTQIWSILYLGSLVCAAIWGWAVFCHIREMREVVAGIMRERVDSSSASDVAEEPCVCAGEPDVEEEKDERLDALAERAKAFIFQNYKNDLSVDDIARSVSLSSSHFSRLFKQQAGKTAKQYLTEVRIEHAKILLARKSVTDTAFAVGFNDSNYFSTVFKKHTGRSPSQYRSKMVPSG